MNTGLRYLCKTSGKKDPYLYKGSGVRWVNHIKKHKSYIITCIIGQYNTKEELVNAGLHYSQLYNVVQDQTWANLTEEKGDGGLVGAGQLGKRWKIKNTSNMRNTKTKTEAWYKGKEKTKGKNNYQFKGIIRTPWGDFETAIDAVNRGKELRQSGNNEVITDRSSLQKYLQSLDTMLNLEGRRTPKSWRGKTPRELGFDFIKDSDVKT
jgi:hypothetical protein